MGADVGDTITLEDVLLVSGDDTKVGTPTVAGAKVTAKVVDHHKGDKVIAFKYRPRGRYRRRVGFRHSHTTLEIVSIDA
jgi:large subunit ribosomal protein L21